MKYTKQQQEEVKHFLEFLDIRTGIKNLEFSNADVITDMQEEIERLNNIINKYVEDMEDYLESNPPVDMQDYTYRVSDIEFLEKDIEELKFITTIRDKLQKLKGDCSND